MRSPFPSLSPLLLAVGLAASASLPPAAPPQSAPREPQAPRPPHAETTHVILVLGAPGEPEFESAFRDQARRWQRVAFDAGAAVTLIDRPPDPDPSPESHVLHESDVPTRAPVVEPASAPLTALAQLQQTLEAEPRDVPADLWLVLIGHGTFDGQDARFNLPGPDLTADDLAAWLQPFRRPLAIINTGSASAPFLPRLSASNRVVITATRSGFQVNFARFGTYLAQAIDDPESDLDHDGQTSLLEAFLTAAHRVAEFYRTEGRLATEHPLLDDNGDGLGTPADWFRGLRPTRRAQNNAPLDGLRAHQFHLKRSPLEAALTPGQRQLRDQLERDVARLRDAKSMLPEADYYHRLESILLELAALYAQLEPAPSSDPDP
ncbi:MAG: hypothetical protein KF833_23445 [Verrucomicrobiae bacterium]|nr:hypothetical protein [Verrucomicrobiae bacterium]